MSIEPGGGSAPGPTIGVAWTHDFRSFTQIENAFLPFDRNGVLFPRRVGGMALVLSRPSDDGHTPFGDIYLSESPDLVHWGRHRHVMASVPAGASRRRSPSATLMPRSGRGVRGPSSRAAGPADAGTRDLPDRR